MTSLSLVCIVLAAMVVYLYIKVTDLHMQVTRLDRAVRRQQRGSSQLGGVYAGQPDRNH